ncbi:TolC family protein [Sphingobacterium faecium]|uniref:TolC family protein n=1 Tax=Sphingobacterium faecium TaxID=34087 RepID=UPI003207F47A
MLQKQNEELKRSNFNLLLSKIDVKEAKDDFIPTLSFGMGHTYNLGLAFDQISGQLVTGNKWSNTANVNLNARGILFQGFSRINKLKITILNVETIEFQKKKLEQSLKLDMLSKYFDVVVNQSLYAVSLKQLEFAKKQLVNEQTKFEFEVNTVLDIAQAESQVANNELNTIAISNSYNKSMVEFKQLLGVPFSDSVVVEIPDKDNSIMSDSEIFARINDDPAIKLGELSVQQGNLLIKNAKSTYYPTLSFFGGYGTNFSSEQRDFFSGVFMPFWKQVNNNRSLNLGISLTMNIFDGSKRKHNLNRMKFNLESKKSELISISVEREKILLLANQEYKKAVSEFQVLQAQNISLAKNYNAVKESYDHGVINAIDYNKALLDYNLAEFNVIKAKYTMLYNMHVLNLLTTN